MLPMQHAQVDVEPSAALEDKFHQKALHGITVTHGVSKLTVPRPRHSEQAKRTFGKHGPHFSPLHCWALPALRIDSLRVCCLRYLGSYRLQG